MYEVEIKRFSIVSEVEYQRSWNNPTKHDHFTISQLLGKVLPHSSQSWGGHVNKWYLNKCRHVVHFDTTGLEELEILLVISRNSLSSGINSQ